MNVRAPRSRPRFLPFLLSGTLAVCFAACSLRPVKPPPVAFSHAAHGNSDCLDCHGSIASSTTDRSSSIPGRKKCNGCHDTPKKGWSREKLFARTPVSLHFSHKQHLAVAKKAKTRSPCKTCHPLVAKSSSPRDHKLPAKKACRRCHASWIADMRCGRCHRDLHLARLKRRFWFAHKGNYRREHGRQARSRMRVCWQCHDQPFCADCHNRLQKNKPSIRHVDSPTRSFIHRGDYVSVHAIEARLDQSRCLECHGASTCSSCHRARGRSPVSKGAKSPHKPGWVRRGSSEFHGSRARLRPATCQACHDQGGSSNCVRCHRVGGTGGNPHPPGWKGRRGSSRSKPPCSHCHGGD